MASGTAVGHNDQAKLEVGVIVGDPCGSGRKTPDSIVDLKGSGALGVEALLGFCDAGGGRPVEVDEGSWEGRYGDQAPDGERDRLTSKKVGLYVVFATYVEAHVAIGGEADGPTEDFPK